jgi:hypothetical protein
LDNEKRVKMKCEIPDMKEILKSKWAHSVGLGARKDKWVKVSILEQGTTPEDKDLLKKLGISKGEKVLAIAGYYASWAKEIKKAGAKVDYSDISKEIVNWTKENIKTKFGKYICSNYELIPKKSEEYDWTFTYEACGAGRGLSIACLRSLLNSKGGMFLIHLGDKKHQEANASKIEKYPNIVRMISEIYGSEASVVKKKIKAHKKGEENVRIHEFLISKIKTNSSARRMAKVDLDFLDWIGDKGKVDKKFKDSLIRLGKLDKVISKDFFRIVEI